MVLRAASDETSFVSTTGLLPAASRLEQCNQLDQSHSSSPFVANDQLHSSPAAS